MKNKKTFLVTGGTGFIGRNIVNLLLKKNYKILVLDDGSRGVFNKTINKNIKYIKGDIREKKLLYKCLKKVDAVIHLSLIHI